jgi:hypothetical protein
VKPPAEGPPVVLFSVVLILAVAGFFSMIVSIANRAWDREKEGPP